MAFTFRYMRYGKLFKYANIINVPKHLSFQDTVHSHLKFCTAATNSDHKNNVSPQLDHDSVINSSSSSHITDDSDMFGSLKVPLEKLRKGHTQKMQDKSKLTSSNPSAVRTSRKSYRREDPADEFGMLSESSPISFSQVSLEDEELEPGDESTVVYPIEKEYRSPEAYLNQMKKLVKEKKLKEALELIPHMSRNNIFPIVSNYTFLIGACGRAGYTEMAFRLLRQMSDRGFRPTCAVLTGLYNSCAECPFPDYGLQKARFLREKVTAKNWQMNRTSYHAMIKAFGRCGDLETAFELVDEMVAAGIHALPKTYNFLLVACITDKDAGFTHAVEVWRKMQAKKIQPDLFSFNLLLRAIRDCGVGPEEISSLLLQHWTSYEKRPYGLNKQARIDTNEMLKLPNPEFSNTKLIGSSEETVESRFKGEKGEDTTLKNRELLISDKLNSSEVVIKNYPNILSKRPVHGPEFINLLDITTSTDRLALVGHADGFLELMKKYKVDPDIKTFTLLLETLPHVTDVEDSLLSLFEVYEVKPDTDFFNILIKRRNMRTGFESAKKVLVFITKHNLCPDIVTFGVLAMGCYKMKHGVQLLRDMRNLGFCANVEILGALVHEASKAMDFSYLKYVLNTMKKDEIKPNERILTKIEETVDKARKSIIDNEQGKEEICIPENFASDFRTFCEFYSDWLQVMEVELDEHPWDQYKANINLRDSDAI